MKSHRKVEVESRVTVIKRNFDWEKVNRSGEQIKSCRKSWRVSSGSGCWDFGVGVEVIEVTDTLSLAEMVEEVCVSWCWRQLEHGHGNCQGGGRMNVSQSLSPLVLYGYLQRVSENLALLQVSLRQWLKISISGLENNSMG